MLRAMFSKLSDWINGSERRRLREERSANIHNRLHETIDACNDIIKKIYSGYYEDYIEYSGEMMPYDVFKYYDHSKQSVSAENLMYSRIRAKYGDVRFEVDKIDVPWPIDTIGALIDMSELHYSHRIKNRRLYWKVKVVD